MKNYYCIDLKFKDNDISTEIYHAHLYIKKKKIFIRIIEKKEERGVSNRFMYKNPLQFFDDQFEIVKSEFEIDTKDSRISGARSSETKLYYSYFTIFLSRIGTIKPNVHKEDINTGKAILNSNGLKVVNQFYSYFTNFKNKNHYEISRMNGMRQYYSLDKFKFRPELDFVSNEVRNSAGFSVKKIPTLKFKYSELDHTNIKENVDLICSFISFCFGIRVDYHRLIYRTENDIYFYFNTEKTELTSKSSFSMVFDLLTTNYRIEKILKTNWHKEYKKKKSKIDKAIDNLLHAREVESSSKYLLLFNIIEIFNEGFTEQKFETDPSKNGNFNVAIDLLEEMLKDPAEIALFRDKCQGIISRVFTKPLKSPLEETLRINGIVSEDFGFSFSQLKKVRDKITHGSVSSIEDEALKQYIYAIRRITICLILSQLGYKRELRNGT